MFLYSTEYMNPGKLFVHKPQYDILFCARVIIEFLSSLSSSMTAENCVPCFHYGNTMFRDECESYLLPNSIALRTLLVFTIQYCFCTLK